MDFACLSWALVLSLVTSCLHHRSPFWSCAQGPSHGDLGGAGFSIGVATFWLPTKAGNLREHQMLVSPSSGGRVSYQLLLLGCLILSLASHLSHASPVVELEGPLVIITKLPWPIVWKCLPSVVIRQNFPKTITLYRLDKLYSLVTLGTFDLCPSIFLHAQFALNGILHSWKSGVGELESGGK